ncbi:MULTISPECIES: hypothetical protein [unclassified Streptomyces]|uniref:hypothetical protein n=1 Tax=Streptomyces sp. NPDC127129 TaxID=3345373 RepID=UPI0036320834
MYAQNDVVLYDRAEDPNETRNLAADPAHRDLVVRYSTLLEALISAEIGTDTRAWITECPHLLGWLKTTGCAAAISAVRAESE